MKVAGRERMEVVRAGFAGTAGDYGVALRTNPPPPAPPRSFLAERGVADASRNPGRSALP